MWNVKRIVFQAFTYERFTVNCLVLYAECFEERPKTDETVCKMNSSCTLSYTSSYTN